MLDFASRGLMELLRPVGRRRKIERQRYVIRRALGPFPVGTECWLSRARPDATAVFEFDDGSVAEVGWGVTGLELEPSWLARLLGAHAPEDTPVLVLVRIARWAEGLYC